MQDVSNKNSRPNPSCRHLFDVCSNNVSKFVNHTFSGNNSGYLENIRSRRSLYLPKPEGIIPAREPTWKETQYNKVLVQEQTDKLTSQ
jgi:hypothetical protein